MKVKEKNKVGRPVKWDLDFISDIESKLDKYINQTEIPILAEFCYKNKISRQKIYEIPELKDSIKRLIDKKESNLERKGLEQNNTMAIFSLKQLGWSDQQKIEHTIVDKDKLREDLKKAFE